MNVDGENVRRSSTSTINVHRLSPSLTADFSSATVLPTDEPSGSGSSRTASHGSHKRGGGGGKKNVNGASHLNGVVNGRKGGRSISPVASSSLASTSSTPASATVRNTSQLPIGSSTPIASNTIPTKRKYPSTMDGRSNTDEDSEAIRCICGFSIDDGWSVGCDGCGRWVHGVCFGFEATDKENLPDHWWCWECDTSLLEKIDRDKARSLQIARLTAVGNTAGNGRRRTSPGVDRKVRKITTSTGAGPSSSMHSAISTNSPSNPSDHSSHKRKRTSAVSASPLTTTSAFPFPPHNANQSSSADDYIDIDESWSHSYIDISQDIVPQSEVRERLRRQAAEWRGVSAISPAQNPSSNPGWPYFDTTPVRYPHTLQPSASPVSLRPLNSSLESVLPPSYAVHTTHPIPSQSYLAPYPSVITSSSTYLRDPLNAYATLGMPKPRVHLMGPPLELSLDARGKGGKARFVRSGCRPNAVLRPILCDGKRESGSISNSHPSRQHESVPNERDESSSRSKRTLPQGTSESSHSLSFAIFALRDLKAEEEVVLGWEWDDANVVHLLPALLQDKGIFPSTQVAAYKLQMANILRALGATFTSCACGERAQGCVMKKMKEFIDEVDDWELEHKQQRNQGFAKHGSDSERTRDASCNQEAQDMQGHMHIQMNVSRSSSESSQERFPPHYTPHNQPTYSETLSVPPTLNFIDSDVPKNSTIALHSQVQSPLHVTQQERLVEEMEPDIAHSFTHPDHSRLNRRAELQSSRSIESQSASTVDLGPLIGVRRGFRTREKVPGSGGLSGVEMDENHVDRADSPVQDERAKNSVRLGPREDVKTHPAESSRTHADYDRSIMYGHRGILPALDHVLPPHHYAYPLHGLPPFPPTISPYGTLHGIPYPLPYAPSPPYIPPTPRSPSIDPRPNGVREALYWGEIPPTIARGDKGKGRALDSDTVIIDGDDDEQIDVEGNQDDVVQEGSARHPKRHQRKRSVYQRRKSPPTVNASDEVAEESEIPPKMKRRWIKKESGSSVGVKGSQRVLDDVDIDQAGRNRPEQDHGRDTSDRRRFTASPVMPPANTTPNRRRSTASPVVPPVPAAFDPLPSNTSPLLSFANLSLLSPAVTVNSTSSSFLYPFSDREALAKTSSHPETWDAPSLGSQSPQHQSISPRPRSQSSHPRRIVTDPLAALAAAAAAARPISPLPQRSYSESRRSWSPHPTQLDTRLGPSFAISPSEHETSTPSMSTTTPASSLRSRRVSTDDNGYSDSNRYRSRFHERGDLDPDKPRSRDPSQASEILENHDAVLGPGGIRVLSSPEHEWLPLRRESTSLSEVSLYGATDDRLYMSRREIDDSSSHPESLKLKQELLDEVIEQSSVHFGPNIDMAVNDGDVVAEPPSQPCTYAPETDGMQVDSALPPLPPFGHQSSLIPTPIHEHQKFNSFSPTDSYIAPLSPSTPPTKNLDEIPPWPASPSPSASSSNMNLPALSNSPVLAARPSQEPEFIQENRTRASAMESEASPLTQSQSMPSPMSALSSVDCSPPSNTNVFKETRRNGEITSEGMRLKSSSPLSSPLSSPMEKLISLPPHSAPSEQSSDSGDEHAEMDRLKIPLSPLPVATVRTSHSSPVTRTGVVLPDVPDLEHSTSMSPLQSPGNISPATPREGESDEVEAMEVDSLTMHDTSHSGSTRTTSINADALPPSTSVQAKINGEHNTGFDESHSTATSTPTLQTFSTPLVAPSTPTISTPKVKKISLKDFAIRKRRQKEEEQREKEEKAKEEQGKVNEEEQKPADQVKEMVVDSGNEEVLDTSVVFGISAEKQESVPHQVSSSETDAPSASVKSVELPAVDLDQIRRHQPKSDVDVIMKASETLNRLMNSSSLSSTLAGSSSTVSVSPIITNHVSSVSNTEVAHPSPSSLGRLRKALQPSAPETTTTPADDHQTFQCVPEDGEIEDGDNSSMIRTSASPMPPSSSTKVSTSSLSSTGSTPKFHSPPPRPFKFHEASAALNEQRSRTPPTQPRSFAVRSPSVSFIPNASPPTRSLALGSAPAANGLSPKPAATNTSLNSTTVPSASPTTNPALGRAPPSGPRAFRQLQQQQHSGGGGGYPGARASSAYIPRGVPYDVRDRDRFRDRAGGSDFVKERERDRDLHWNGAGARIRARDVGGWAR
ncbi:Le.MFB1 [Lentinula detonsa]|uniref:Le.MFB1 n=1 Tax=Lentinula detonsa TaxID=2804962 RepID=A0A9W8P8A1_9AGAR|nr:Le.MFB1 [Lentinula detonsa]